MSRAGRKRKSGIREPNGRLSRIDSERISRGLEVAPRSWCVYFLQSDLSVKIGFTGRIGQRVPALECERAVQLRIVGLIDLPSRLIARALEGKFHEIFADRRIEGEWFSITELDVVGALRMASGIGLKTYGAEEGFEPALKTSLSGDMAMKMTGVIYESGGYVVGPGGRV